MPPDLLHMLFITVFLRAYWALEGFDDALFGGEMTVERVIMAEI